MKCFKCKGDLIYLGANYHPNMIAMAVAMELNDKQSVLIKIISEIDEEV